MSELAILYSRVSTDMQDNSLHIQDDRLRGYLASKGLVTAPELCFADEAVSGRIPIFERPEGKQAYAILREGWVPPGASPLTGRVPVHHIVCKTVDRLGRNAKDALGLYEWFQTNGKTLHLTDLMGDQVTTSGMLGKMFFAFAALFAEFEVETIRERIRTTMGSKMQAGELIGTVPYGWDTEPTGRIASKSGKEILRLVPNDGEQLWLRQMLEWRAAGLTWNAIATRLNRMGVATKIPAGTMICVGRDDLGHRRMQPHSGQWHASTVKKALTNKHTRHLGPAPEAPELEHAEVEELVA